MKKIFSIFMVFAAALTFVACDKAPIEEQKPVKFEVTSESFVEIEAEGGDLVIEYTIENPKAGATVMATTEADWIKETDESYATDGKIALLVELNEKESSRMATIEVRYDTFVKSVSVKQLGATPVSPDAPVLSIEKSTVEVSVEGGSYSVAYSVENAVEGVGPVATTEAEWVTELKAEAGAISFVVEANEEFEPREAKVTVAYEGAKSVEFSVKQVALTRPELIVGKSELEVAASGGEYSISYVIKNAIAGEELKLTTEANWLTVSATDYAIKLQAAANESPEPRETIIKVEYLGVEACEVVITQAGKQEEVQTEAIKINSVELMCDYGDELEIWFYSDNDCYVFDVLKGLQNGVLPDGTYSIADGTMSKKYCVHGNYSVQATIKEATLTVSSNGNGSTFNIIWVYNDVNYTIDWTGKVLGFNYSNLSSATMVDVSRASVYYDKVGEKEVVFWFSEFGGHKFNFKHADIVVGKPIPDGTYSTADGTMSLNYCIHSYGEDYASMTSAKVVVTNDFDNETATFKIEWVYDGADYGINYTGAVEGYNYEEVTGTTLDFVPTYVELVDAGFAGLYFYFYDVQENELVFNLDKGKIYMPYINYNDTKIDINNEDYTFEYTDNGDGTYTYNARFVTLDGRIIKFAGPLPTSVN